ncbi:hypothetical protein ON010_g5992 [Phytophthora cinnamomi]|nr:hypothetical protein ON010_g5992 [Phytophthora cinnamomi]
MVVNRPPGVGHRGNVAGHCYSDTALLDVFNGSLASSCVSGPCDSNTNLLNVFDGSLASFVSALAEAVQGGVDEHEEDAVEIEVELFGAWVKIQVKRSSLRAALRLPQHDIFSRGIFHGFQPEMMMPQGSDIPDSDHNALMEMEP